MMEVITETIGCDLGDKQSELCILLRSGEMQRPEAVKTTRKGFTEFFTRPRAHVVIEVGQHSRWVSELLEQLGHKVTVANPRKVKLISQGHTKRDSKDAELLARLAKADEALLSPVQHRGSEAQGDLAVAKARDALVRTRTKLVNHARGLVKSFGERLPSCTAETFHRKAKADVPTALKPALDPVFSVLEHLDDQITIYDKTLDRLAKKYPDVDVISQPKGVGRQRQAAGHHQGGGRVPAKVGGGKRELHPRPLRRGQRAATVGTRTGEERSRRRKPENMSPSPATTCTDVRKVDSKVVGQAGCWSSSSLETRPFTTATH